MGGLNDRISWPATGLPSGNSFLNPLLDADSTPCYSKHKRCPRWEDESDPMLITKNNGG